MASALSLSKVRRALDVRFAEHVFGVKLIVSATSDPDIRSIIHPTERAGLDVIELQESSLLTTLSIDAPKGALLPVALEHLPPHRARHAARLGLPK